MTKAKSTKKQNRLITTEEEYEKESDIFSIVGNYKEFINYREKLTNLDSKHLMIVGCSDEDINVFVEYIRKLGFKQTIFVDCTGKNKKSIKEKIIDSMYTYYSEKDSYENLRRASTADMLNKKETTNVEKECSVITAYVY